ncbi:hypothetical protein FALBO_16984 [Fusarium albosuccineum]|uniref:Uncharacterized protein n=1 Tax=Fusarium albosuccineum TaxID=1237068 RepID=A0A8H4KC56_9HYPO|nr:hypothetical protein FALBO_16984 [Fusarium albosuccineum]
MGLPNEKSWTKGLLIDGLFAALSYLDKVQAVTDKAYQSLSNATEHTQINDPTLLATAESARHSLQIDWSPIQDIQVGMAKCWQRLVDSSKSSPTPSTPEVNTLLKIYSNATRLQEAGIFAFRNTLTSATPDSLDKMFALYSLSYVVSCYLIKKRKLAEHNIMADVDVWRSALQSAEDRQAFTSLAETCWPKAIRDLPCTSTLQDFSYSNSYPYTTSLLYITSLVTTIKEVT